LLTWLLLVGATLVFLLPMFAVPDGIASGDAFRDNDWLNCRSFDLLSRQAMLEHGQFPLRSHLVGGGFPVTAHPSDGSWAPTIIAVLLFGDVLGVKLNLALLFLAGVFGVYAMARRWLELDRPASVIAALGFCFSAWAPSMSLSGFYHQAFYLLVPLALYFLLCGAGRLDRLLWAGMLVLGVFQQGGHSFAAVTYFLGAVIWLQAARESAPSGTARQRWGPPLLVVLALGASLAVAKGLRWPPYPYGLWTLLIPAGVAAGVALWSTRSSRLRAFWLHLLPWAGRLGVVLATALALGAARVVSVIYLSRHGEYTPGLSRMRYWFLTDKRDETWIERFYEGPGDFLAGLLQRLPGVIDYGDFHGRPGSNIDYEYAYLGLTVLPLALALAGLILGRRKPGVDLLLLLGALFSLICLGRFVPPDFHFLLVWGVPWAGELSQPLKYYNFFILLPLVLLAGVGAQDVKSRLGKWPRAQAVIAWGLLAVLVLPFVQNRPILGELFAHPRPAPAAEPYHQVAMVARASMLSLPPEKIRAQNERERLRDYRRPRPATEYFNVRRGVGTVDWYGTVVGREDAVPSQYITPNGKTWKNPHYKGEAWLAQGRGKILSLEVSPNVIHARVRLDAPDTVVINQSYLTGFFASTGVLAEEPGLLKGTLDRAGEHDVRLTYRPTLFIAGLVLSGLALAAWVVVQLLLWRRRKRRGDRAKS